MSTKLPQSTVPIRGRVHSPLRPTGLHVRPVRGLIFDTGDVLYDATVWRRWLLKTLGRLGLSTSYSTFYRIWDQDFWADVCCGRREFWEAFRAFLLSAGLCRGQIEEVEVAARAQRRQWLATARLFPGVSDAIARLSDAGVVLAAICDSELPRNALDQQFHRLGLSPSLRAVVCSQDLERAKPDPACYGAALDTMHLSAHEVGFVGHDSQELAEAARLGMQTLAFNHDHDAQADVYLTCFGELVEGILSPRPVAVAG